MSCRKRKRRDNGFQCISITLEEKNFLLLLNLPTAFLGIDVEGCDIALRGFHIIKQNEKIILILYKVIGFKIPNIVRLVNRISSFLSGVP